MLTGFPKRFNSCRRRWIWISMFRNRSKEAEAGGGERENTEEDAISEEDLRFLIKFCEKIFSRINMDESYSLTYIRLDSLKK